MVWPLEFSYSSLLLIEDIQIPRGGNGTTNLLDLGLNTRFQFDKELKFSQSPARQFAVGSVSMGHLLKGCSSHNQNLPHGAPKLLRDLEGRS